LEAGLVGAELVVEAVVKRESKCKLKQKAALNVKERQGERRKMNIK
jgi:hypothetical protein